MTEPNVESASSGPPNGGILNKFRRAYRWYKQHNPSSDTESDESDEYGSDVERRKSSTARDQVPGETESKEGQEDCPRAKPTVIKSASTESEFKKRFSIAKSDYLKFQLVIICHQLLQWVNHSLNQIQRNQSINQSFTEGDRPLQ